MLRGLVAALSGVLIALVLPDWVLRFVDWLHYKGAVDIDGRLFSRVQVDASGIVIGGKEGCRYKDLASAEKFFHKPAFCVDCYAESGS